MTIRVTDVNGEPRLRRSRRTVTAVSSTSLQVTWEEPDEHRPAHNRLRLPVPGADGDLDGGHEYHDHGSTAVTIEGLAASTSYDVEVRATNAEGTSDWSNPGIGSTNAPGANNPPVFYRRV